jgi:hypothetical protein
MRSNELFAISVHVHTKDEQKTYNIDIDESRYEFDDIEEYAVELFNDEFDTELDTSDCDFTITVTDDRLKDIGIETADDLEDFCNVFYSDDNYYDFEVFEAAYGCDIPFEDVNEMYQGEWEDDETFVMRLLEDTGMIPSDLPNFIYIDWERTAETVMDDYVENRGHYFRQ